MVLSFSARQKQLGLSECEYMLRRGSRDVERFASVSGWQGIAGSLLKVDVGQAINMLIRSNAEHHGIEPTASAGWLPPLRNEALLKLAEDYHNWSVDGPDDSDKEFWPTFWETPDVVRGSVGRLLGCCVATARREMRFHAGGDVELLTDAQYGWDHSRRSPLFTIDAHEIAARLRESTSGALFIAKPAKVSV